MEGRSVFPVLVRITGFFSFIHTYFFLDQEEIKVPLRPSPMSNFLCQAQRIKQAAMFSFKSRLFFSPDHRKIFYCSETSVILLR